jgi:hypothetical protein
LFLSYFILNTAGFSIISTGTGVGFTPSVARAVSSTLKDSVNNSFSTG